MLLFVVVENLVLKMAVWMNCCLHVFFHKFPTNHKIYTLKILKEELHTRILKNLKEREKYSLQNSAKMMKIG